jgi:hypothetical protein
MGWLFPEPGFRGPGWKGLGRKFWQSAFSMNANGFLYRGFNRLHFQESIGQGRKHAA